MTTNRYYLKSIKRWSMFPESELNLKLITKAEFTKEKKEFIKLCESISEGEREFINSSYKCNDKNKVINLIQNLRQQGFEYSIKQTEIYYGERKKRDREAIVRLDKVFYSHKFKCFYYHQICFIKELKRDEFRYMFKSGLYYWKGGRYEFGWKGEPLTKFVDPQMGIPSYFM